MHLISKDQISLDHLRKLLEQKSPIQLSEASRKAVTSCRTFLEKKLEEPNAQFYGINTGFGSLCNVKISQEEITTLQRNLVLSHACGMGDEVPIEVVQLILFLKIQSLSYGNSGVRPILIDRLIYFYNNEIYPVIYQQGSLGASGDLAPLAHLSLPLIGEGEVWYQGKKIQTKDLPESVQVKPLALASKEGLALLNGTQFSTAYGAWALIQAERLSEQADLIAAISMDAFQVQMTPFDDRLHQIRPHQGQIETASAIRMWRAESPLATGKAISVQDPYAFRCVPQVHGASKQALAHVKSIFTTEINSVTDNPNLFPETDGILSGGNFHAQPLALPLDYLAIALSELGSIAERRTFQLISGLRGLPAFLIKNGGLNSGFMIPQYTAASIASQNKQLSTPASVDSIVSSNGQEDHVSMAANAGTKLYQVVHNVARILAIEWMTATQALSFRRPLQSSPKIEAIVAQYRKEVPILTNDRNMSIDMHKTVDFLKKLKL